MTTRVLSRTFAFIAILLLLLLSACARGKAGEQTPTPGATTVAGEGTAAGTPTSPSSPAGSPTLEAAGVQQLSAANFAADGEGMHGLILFTSSAKQPFADILLAEPDLPYAERQLWAVSPDGKRAGRISPDGYGADLLTAKQTGAKPKLLEYGFTINNEAVEAIAAPESCGTAEPPCGNLSLSPDGRFLVYFSGEYNDCGREMQVVDLRSDTVARTFPGAQWAYFAANSSLILQHGTCEQAQTAVYYPHNDKYAGMSKGGDFYWNPSHSAALIQARQTVGLYPGLWGFDMQAGKVFMWMDDPNVLEDLPTWTPQGNTYLFNHRKVHFDKGSHTLLLKGPRQILWMNADNRSQRRLAFAPGYDYHLCSNEGKPCDEWYGDWVKVLRTPFKSIAFQIDPITGKFEDRPDVRCALTGSSCAEPAEIFALNWKTGELVPWDEANLGEAAPALVNGPDTSVEPIYAEPGGAFTFYPGLDGHSLWYVPGNGEPKLWIKDGEVFVYLP